MFTDAWFLTDFPKLSNCEQTSRGPTMPNCLPRDSKLETVRVPSASGRPELEIATLELALTYGLMPVWICITSRPSRWSEGVVERKLKIYSAQTNPGHAPVPAAENAKEWNTSGVAGASEIENKGWGPRATVTSICLTQLISLEWS